MALDKGNSQWLRTLRLLTWAFVLKWITVRYTCAQVNIVKEEDIIVLNRGIEVPFGRSVFVDPLQNLTIDVSAGDRCKVTVLQNDPLSQRPGVLLPTVFPCEFGPREVYYSHFGSRSPSEDRVQLMIRYDSNTRTYIIPFTLTVKIIYVQLEILTKNMPLRVDKLLGTSDAITNKNTQFAYDTDNQICRVTILTRKTGLPRYGHTVNETSSLSMIDCKEFIKMGITYQHTASTNSPNRDYIPMVLEVSDRDGTAMKQEYFKKPVIILEGLQNTQPQPSIDAFLVMEVSNDQAVDQFVMTAIPPQVLSADDIETPAEQLIFNITRPLRPGQGSIVSTDNRNLPVRSFYQKDIQDLKIAYKPPASDSNMLRTFTVEMQVIDAEGLASVPFTLMIVVKPMNTLAPVVTTNAGIQLFEGQSRQLLSSQNLRISDEDNLDVVKIFVADGVRHGQLRLPPGRGYFTPADLDAGNIVYQHDGSDTYSDNVVFRMTDGQNEVQFLFPITIYPIDDQSPILNVNTGLEITKHQEKALTRFILSATDVDSEDSYITFTIQPPFSKEGVLIKKQFQVPDDVQNWKFINRVYEKPVDKFTQQDIIDNKVFYRHTGRHRSNVYMDRVRFKLSDTAEPPNESDVYTFVVKVQPLDDQPPYLHPNTRLRLDIDESQFIPLKRKFLRFTDDDTDDRQLQYIITKPPYDTDPRSRMSAGSIVLCDSPGTVVFTFSQAQVNHHKICYRPPDSELGLAKQILQFTFDVEDTNGNVLPNQQFTIVVNPVNNKPPIVKNSGFSIYENGMMVIGPAILDVSDPDSEVSNIRFVVTEVPYYGNLQNLQQTLSVGDSFRRQDILDKSIVYVNTGQRTDKDRFTLMVTDGIHRILAVVNIDVTSVDDQSSSLKDLGGGVLSLELDVPEGGAVPLSSHDFHAFVTDTNRTKLTFIINKAPERGFLMVKGKKVNRFTQNDLTDGKTTYKHVSGEIGQYSQNDTFTLTLSNPGFYRSIFDGNIVRRVEALVRIHPVDNAAPQVILGARYEVLESNKEPILPRHLDVFDDDTSDEKLQCVIVKQPSIGYIETVSPAPGSEKSRVGIPLTAFYVRDLRVGNVNYVQSVHKGSENRRDEFSFFCSDGVNISPQYNFNISIYPGNDEIPVIHTREFVVMEGLELSIDTPILMATDDDQPPDELTFIITNPPLHGQILKQRNLAGTFPITKFKMADIEESSTIMYKHDDSETTRDSFEFIVTDGKHNVSKVVPIIILPVDDETPRLSVNNGLEIEKVGESKIITNDILRAEDVDSPDSNITFIIRKIPTQGYLLKTDENGVRNLTLGMNFTQFNIDNLQIQYVHTGMEGIRDLIKFDVTDGLNPLIDRYFYVTISGLDTIFPRVITRGVQLPEGGTVTLTSDILSSSDLNSPDENLRYTVINAPQHGYLESTDSPGVPITTFTQLDVAGSKIRYVHSSNSEIKMDRFEFEVTDGFNPVMRTFRIAISDVDNKKPVLIFNTLRVTEGGNKIVTPFELKAVDQDTSSDKLVFTITQVPLHGNILLNFSRTVNRFTYKDLEDNSISYQHDGTETIKDSFSVTITDGTHSEFYVFSDTTTPTKFPQTMHIEIAPVDNGVPQVTVNKGVRSLEELDTGGLGVVLTNKVLQTTDLDSPKGSLTYLLTSRPEHGYIIHRDRGNVSISTWTQDDIDNMKIQYMLNPGSNVTSDTFFFKVRDVGGNVLANQPFSLMWSWISFSKQNYVINETEEILEVRLKRRGYLGETSFVTISAENMTARVGVDTTEWFAPQVQFNPGQTEKSWRIHLKDDDKFEGPEYFLLRLSDPVMTLVEQPSVTRVTIHDFEDESVVYIPDEEYRVEEKVGEVLIPVRRTGDVTGELMVICTTVSDTATGTHDNQVLSGSDYISRPDDQRSIIRFDTMQTERFCRVPIIDDSLYEEEERFQVALQETMGGRVGEGKTSAVYIEPDKDDEPVFYFDKSTYTVDESIHAQLDVVIWRTGTDLTKPSSVTIRSRMTKPRSAEAGIDYIAVNKILDFAPGVTKNTVAVRILDDLGQPEIEGVESFEILLKGPKGASLSQPNRTTISINDTHTDAPAMFFTESSLMVREEDGHVTATIKRFGDLRHSSSVRCYTRQLTALVMMDYEERPDTDESLVQFGPGDREKPCIVRIVNDTIYESEEIFQLVLGSPTTSTDRTPVGFSNSVIIRIQDDSDKPVIMFPKKQFRVTEPRFIGTLGTVKIPVVRKGDNSKQSIVRLSTKSGSALAGKDFNPLTRELYFRPNVSEIVTEIQILPDRVRENSEVFTVHLQEDKERNAEVKRKHARVYIVENNKMANVVFPDRPRVVSLRDYDDVENAEAQPINGYPVICVTACNPKHPEFSKTERLCKSQKINDTLTKFRWLVAPPTKNRVTSPLRDIVSTAFFAPTWKITLDSVYFGPGSRVQCVATPVNNDGDPGRDVKGDPVTIATEDGLCLAMDSETVGNEPFTAKLRYLGPGDKKHPNMVRITVTIPHRDGLLPVVSTYKPSNYEFILSHSSLRVAQHQCSNLLDVTDYNAPQDRWFLSNSTRNKDAIGEVEPHQFSKELRTASTLRFYQNLNLESCLWEFNGYFNMSELVKFCGGQIATDGQAINLKQSAVTLRVPLYVTYVSHSPTATGWKHVDMETTMTLTFVYDTAILWQNGISTQTDTEVRGNLHPTEVRITDDNKLAVKFRTDAKFRGLFIPQSKDGSLISRVTSPDHPDLDFDLRLLRSDPTFEQPQQLWEFSSKLAKQDYSGIYNIRLIPCTTPVYQQYSLPINCNPQDHVTFDLPIRFQQVSDPVSSEFSLNTDFNLMRKRSLWVSEGSPSLKEDTDEVFAPGDKIYGRVDIDSRQGIGEEFKLNLEKVFLCSGKDGYIPKYNPSQGEYGCLANSPSLQHSIKILDRRAPHTVDTDVEGYPLTAVLAIDDPTAVKLVKQAGADGFSLDTGPLFELDPGRMWFLHTIYTVKSATGSSFKGKRSVSHMTHKSRSFPESRSFHESRSKRALEDTEGIGDSGKGTNMVRIVLSTSLRREDPDLSVYEVAHNTDNPGHSLIPILLGILIFFVIAIILMVVYIRRRRKHSSPPPSPTSTMTVISKSGKTKVLRVDTDSDPSSDRTEV